MSKRMKFYVLVALVALVAGAIAVGTVSAQHRGGVDAKRAFELLKKLEGEWEGVSNQGSFEGTRYGPVITKPAQRLKYEVLARGNAVVATNIVPKGNEMFTVYTLVRNDLMATHYCVTGVQTEMKLDRRASRENRLVFEFVRTNNLENREQFYMHSGSLDVQDGDRIRSQWRMVQGRKEAGRDTLIWKRL